MRKITLLAASAAMLAALPAAAQLAGPIGGPLGTTVNAGVNTTVNTAPVTDTVLNTAARTVDTTQRVADQTMGTTSLVLVTRAQVRTGLVVRDARGQRIGTVSRIDGNSAVVVEGRRMYHVPLSALYRRTTGAAGNLYSSIPRAQLTAHVNAKASTNSAVHTGH